MKLTAPIIITPRLMAGLQIGNGTISIDYSDRPGDGTRTRYRYFIDLDGHEHDNDDLQSGCQGGTLQEGLASLLSFLIAAGESYDYFTRTGRESDNAGLFPAWVAEWCSANLGDLTIIASDIEEQSLIAE